MTDEQRLSQDLRQLQTDDEPNPAFADALFTQLQEEVVAPRGNSSAWLLLAAAALIAALAVGAALGSGLVKVPFLIADASATPTPSASASPTEPASPTTSASGEPSTEGPSPTPSPGSLEVGAVARITADALTLRANPGLQGEPYGTLTFDNVGFIVGGPVEEDGYAWYQLAGMGIPPGSGCEEAPVDTPTLTCPSWFGWLAAADIEGSPWLEATSLVCPESPMNIGTLAVGRGNVERLACSGNRPITVRGWWPELPDGLGGACAGSEHPSGWLYCQNINYLALLVDETQEFGGVGLPLNVDPNSDVAMPARGQWIEIDGHFDDPDAQGCDEAAAEGEEVTEDPAQTVLTCRTQLVVDAVKPVSGPF